MQPARKKPTLVTGSAQDLESSRMRILKRVGFSVAGALLLLIAIGAVDRFITHREVLAALEARQNAVPMVRVQTVKATTDPRSLSLPGTTQAFDFATIYARQSGYISERHVDIGSHVKAGDLLAVISAPEVGDQLNQARAQLIQMEAALRQAHANQSLAQMTDQRTRKLAAQGYQSLQQADNDRLTLQAQTAGVGMAEANIEAQKAQVARLEKMQSYARVIAPIDGVITQRNIDVGSLVTADSSTGTSLFAIAHSDVLRVQVYVPQDAAFGLKAGTPAMVSVPEFPGRTFTGKVARTADALQAGTRTLLAEVDVDNPDGALAAGVYCTVHFDVPRANPMIVIPAEALIFNRDGAQVATFDNGKAHIHKVQIAQDDGAELDISAGLKPMDQVIVSAPVDLVDGATVQIQPEPKKTPAHD